MNEAALKDRLKSIATEKKTTLNKIWKQLLLERFLSRLSSSQYHDKFIFKGGLLLAQYVSINRETIDIDFLMTKMDHEISKIEESIKAIAAIDLKDEFHFIWFSIEELNHPHMEYGGFHITLDVKFSNMQDKIHIDVAIGDTVEPVEAIFGAFQYKGKPIFEGEISLSVYPPEAIFSEKLETIISKGSINSRMKDYHDLLVMIREPDLLNARFVFLYSRKIMTTEATRQSAMNALNHWRCFSSFNIFCKSAPKNNQAAKQGKQTIKKIALSIKALFKTFVLMAKIEMAPTAINQALGLTH